MRASPPGVFTRSRGRGDEELRIETKHLPRSSQVIYNEIHYLVGMGGVLYQWRLKSILGEPDGYGPWWTAGTSTSYH